MIRLTPNHAKAIRRAPTVTFTFDGHPIEGHAGEPLVAALLRAGHLALRDAPAGGARGAFCCMGLCQDCAVVINGQVVEACRTEVSGGPTVARRR